jgi:hypothetical protein
MKWGLLFDERRDLTITGHPLSTWEGELELENICDNHHLEAASYYQLIRNFQLLLFS